MTQQSEATYERSLEEHKENKEVLCSTTCDAVQASCGAESSAVSHQSGIGRSLRTLWAQLIQPWTALADLSRLSPPEAAGQSNATLLIKSKGCLLL